MRRITIGAVICIFSMLFLAPMACGSSYSSPSTPGLTWGVKAGDVVVINNHIGMGLTASDTTWDAIDAALNHTINSKQAWGNISALMPSDLGLQLTINNVSSQLYNYNETYLGNTSVETYNIDTINAGMKIRSNSSSAFVDPGVFMGQEMTAIYTALMNIMGVTPDASMLAHVGDPYTRMAGNFTALPLVSWEGNLHVNGTYDTSSYYPPDYPKAPATAIPEGPTSLLIKPKEFDFLKEWNYIKALYSYMYNATKTTTYMTYLLPTLDAFMAQFGIGNVYADSNALSMTLNLANINQTNPIIAPFLGAYLNMTGIQKNITGTLTFGVEYASNGALNRLGFWFDGTMSLNLTSAMTYLPSDTSNGPHAASTGTVPVSISLGSTMTQNGQTPLTKEDVAAGKIGAAASGGAFSVAGFPTEWIMVIGAVSIVAMIIRKRNH